MTTRIALLLDADSRRIEIRPLDRLANDEFRTYLDVMRGSQTRYDTVRRRWLCSLYEVGTISDRLRENGYNVVATPEVVAALDSAAARHEADAAKKIEVARAEVSSLEGLAAAAVEHVRSRPRSRDLYPYQIAGAAYLAASSGGALLCDQMGLGKTVQALLAARDRIVIIVPASMRRVWAAESQKWRPDLVPAVLNGRGVWKWPRDGEIVIVGWDSLPEDVDAPDAPVDLVLDEVHYAKGGSKTKRGRAARKIAATVLKAGGRAWGMTGTPLKNRPGDLWNVLKCVGVDTVAFPKGWPEFTRMFGGVRGRYGYEWSIGSGRPDEIPARLARVMLRRTREQVLPDLPVATRRDILIEDFPASARAAADRVIDWLASTGRTVEDLFEGLSVPAEMIGEIARARAALATAKIGVLLEMVEGFEEENEPLVVFSAHRAPIDALATRPGWGRISGEDSSEKRAEVVEAFQSGRLKGVAVVIRAGGVGLTLTRAAHAIFVDLEWSPADNSQAEDRLVRIGQTRGVVIHRLVADHELDRRVAAVLAEKQMILASTIERVQGEAADATEAAMAASYLVGDAIKKAADEAEMMRRAAEQLRTSILSAPVIAREECWRPGRRGPKTEEERAAWAFWNSDARPTGSDFFDNLANGCRDGEGLSEKMWMWAVKIARERTTPRTPITVEQKTVIVEAARRLAGMCDGAQRIDNVGFNKMDARRGRDIAYSTVEALPDDDALKAARMLSKYRRQLGDDIANTLKEVGK